MCEDEKSIDSFVQNSRLKIKSLSFLNFEKEDIGIMKILMDKFISLNLKNLTFVTKDKAKENVRCSFFSLVTLYLRNEFN